VSEESWRANTARRALKGKARVRKKETDREVNFANY
jgi:hypothetical protein